MARFPPGDHAAYHGLSSLDISPRPVRPLAEIRKGVGADMILAKQLASCSRRRQAFARIVVQALHPSRDSSADGLHQSTVKRREGITVFQTYPLAALAAGKPCRPGKGACRVNVCTRAAKQKARRSPRYSPARRASVIGEWPCRTAAAIGCCAYVVFPAIRVRTAASSEAVGDRAQLNKATA